MIDYYQIKSPLSQITEERMEYFINSLSKILEEPFCKVPLETYISDDFALLYVASGGSEGYFIEVFDSLKDKPCYILTSGDSNSLAASMEILSYLRAHGAKGEILHGSFEGIANRIKSLRNAHSAKAALNGKTLACVGKPSDWLIASSYCDTAVSEKLGISLISISIDELLAEIAVNQYPENEFTELFLNKQFPADETKKALYVYGAFERLTEKYNLCGMTVRCFDLLDTVKTTGCLGLSILNSKGIYGGCEGDVPALLSMVILGAVSNKPMFLCNPSRFDTDAGTAVFAHCTVPVNMLKEFELNTHFESGIGAAVQGKFNKGSCTIFKCSGDLSRFHAQNGEILEMPFSDKLCRTQIKVKLNDFSYFLNRPINNHHIICCGDYTQAIEDFFNIL